jgi:hypothetical protein
MDVELIEIREFLASHAPFDQLPGTTLDALVGEAKVLKRNKKRPRDHIPYLYAKEDIKVTPPQNNQSAGNNNNTG